MTVTAAGDALDEPDGTVTVSATVSGGGAPAALAPAAETLAIVDDDDPPTVSISSPRATEGAAGATTTLSFAVTLDAESGREVTVDYAEAAGGTAAAGTDYTALAAGTLTMAAGETVATVDVTVVGDAADEADETVKVALSNPANATLSATAATGTGAIADDDALPTVTLLLSEPDSSSPDAISENGGAATVTAALSHPSGEAVTVTVSAAAVSPATASDFAQSGTTLTIAAGATTSAGLVTVTAADNDAVAADKSVRVSGTTAGGRGAADPAAVTLTIENDDRAPVVTLVLTPATVAESAASWSWVTAKLSHPASEAATVTVTSAPVFPAVAADYYQAGSTLTIAAGATTSTGEVAVIPHGNDVDAPDKEVVVSGRVSGGSGAANPRDVTVTIEDDEALPVVTLLLSEPDSSSPDAISENGGVSTVTARLSGKSSEAVTVTVSAAAAGGDTVVGDFALSAAKTLTIAAGSTTSAGTVTVTAVNDAGDAAATHEPDRSVTVSGDAAGGNGVADPAGRTLTIADDESAPGVTLALSPASISENGGTATVTATLSGRSRAATTITVTGVSGSWTAGSDATIVIAAGATANASDTATVAAVDDDVHQGSAGRPVTVTATAGNAVGAGAVTGAALTLTDDETPPTVTLALSPASISENGGTATVTARLSAKSSAAVTVTVAAAAAPPAVAGDSR